MKLRTEYFLEQGGSPALLLYDETKSGYDGLMELRNGDELIIYDEDEGILWRGIIDKNYNLKKYLRPYYRVFETNLEAFRWYWLNQNGIESPESELLEQPMFFKMYSEVLNYTHSELLELLFDNYSAPYQGVEWIQRGEDAIRWIKLFRDENPVHLVRRETVGELSQ